MSEQLVFDYYYGKEADMFSFLRVPRLLIKDPHFRELSNDAKMLYGLMLDRMSLSMKNEWQDEDGKTYIIYTIEQIAEDLACSRTKAIRVLSELDAKGGIGLVEKVKRGLGKPDIIYVKNFVCVKVIEDRNVEEKPENPCDSTEVPNWDFKESQNETSRNPKLGLQEVSNEDFKKSQNETSRNPKMELQEVAETDPNYIDSNYTDPSYTEVSHIDMETYQSIHPEEEANCDEIDRIEETRNMIKSNIEYEYMIKNHNISVKILDELIEIMVEVIVMNAKFVRIGGSEIPKVLVVRRFMKYDYSIMEYVLTSLSGNCTKVKNIRGYMLATLYNAPATIENYYQAEVNHDMHGFE